MIKKKIKYTDFNSWENKRQEKIMEVILEEDLEKLKSQVSFVDVLQKDSKIYVKDTNIPIRKLRKLDYNIVTSVDDADVVIMRKKDVESELKMYFGTFYECSRGRWTDDEDDRIRIKDGKELKALDCYCNEKELATMEEMEALTSKLFYDPIDICFGKEELDDNMAIRIEDMINSNQKEMQDLALRFLMNFDVKRNAHKIAAIMDYVPNYRHKDTRFFIDNLKIFYPEFERKNWTTWIEMQIQHPDCQIINRNFNRFVKKHTGLSDNYKITKYEL